MDLGISGKTALVCASSKGLGLGCAIALANAGVDLLMCARNIEQLTISADLVKKNRRCSKNRSLRYYYQ